MKDYCLEVVLPFVLGIVIVFGVAYGIFSLLLFFGGGVTFTVVLGITFIGYSIHWWFTRRASP